MTIGKPGPGCLSEALLKGLPVIVERNARTLPQERYNADWVRRKQVGLAVRSFAHINRAVEHLLAPANFLRCRENAAGLRNRAVFEVVEVLDRLLSTASATEAVSEDREAVARLPGRLSGVAFTNS